MSVTLGSGDVLLEVSADGKTYRLWPQRALPSEQFSAQ